MDIGEFLDTEYERKILAETLKVNENMIFEQELLKDNSLSLKVEPSKDVASMFSKAAKPDNSSFVMIL